MRVYVYLFPLYETNNLFFVLKALWLCQIPDSIWSL